MRAVACGLEDEASGHGFLDDLRLSCELAVTRVFDAVARVARRLVFMPEPPPGGVARAASPPQREPSVRGRRRSVGGRSSAAAPESSSVSFHRRCAMVCTWQSCGGTTAQAVHVGPCVSNAG